jgi:hypothetical protein
LRITESATEPNLATPARSETWQNALASRYWLEPAAIVVLGAGSANNGVTYGCPETWQNGSAYRRHAFAARDDGRLEPSVCLLDLARDAPGAAGLGDLGRLLGQCQGVVAAAFRGVDVD